MCARRNAGSGAVTGSAHTEADHTFEVPYDILLCSVRCREGWPDRRSTALAGTPAGAGGCTALCSSQRAGLPAPLALATCSLSDHSPALPRPLPCPAPRCRWAPSTPPLASRACGSTAGSSSRWRMRRHCAATSGGVAVAAPLWPLRRSPRQAQRMCNRPAGCAQPLPPLQQDHRARHAAQRVARRTQAPAVLRGGERGRSTTGACRAAEGWPRLPLAAALAHCAPTRTAHAALFRRWAAALRAWRWPLSCTTWWWRMWLTSSLTSRPASAAWHKRRRCLHRCRELAGHTHSRPPRAPFPAPLQNDVSLTLVDGLDSLLNSFHR